MKVKLTEELIRTRLRCPEGKDRVELCCTEGPPGFYAEVRATAPGECSFYLRYKDRDAVTRHRKIGRSTEITLADARRKAKELKSAIVLGADPVAEAKAQRASLIFEKFFTEHYLPHVKPRKRSWRRDEELFRLRIKAKFGHLRLADIRRQQLQAFHTDLRTEGLAPATCDHHLKLIKHALNLAIEWEMLEKNPASRVPLFNADNRVEHYLLDEQLARLLRVLRTDANRAVCRIALFLLATGARLGEALSATWDQIDRTGRVWRIPARSSKSKRVRSVALNDAAIGVLDELPTEGKFAHLFVNERRSKETEQRYTTIMKVWRRLRITAELPRLRIHDLRHNSGNRIIPRAATGDLQAARGCLIRARRRP